MGLGPISLLGTLATTTLQIAGQQQAAKAATQQAQAVTDAAKYNAMLAENEARNRELETSQSIIRQRASNRDALAELQNRLSNSGTRSDTGTPLLLAGESAARMELNIADAARAASMQAHSLRAQGQMGLWEAGQATRQAAYKNQAGKLVMAATAIDGLTKAFGQYQEGSYQGMFPRIGKL